MFITQWGCFKLQVLNWKTTQNATKSRKNATESDKEPQSATKGKKKHRKPQNITRSSMLTIHRYFYFLKYFIKGFVYLGFYFRVQQPVIASKLLCFHFNDIN